GSVRSWLWSWVPASSWRDGWRRSPRSGLWSARARRIFGLRRGPWQWCGSQGWRCSTARRKACARSPNPCLPQFWQAQCSTPRSTRARTTGNRCGPARRISCSPLRCGGRGPCKSQNKQADRDTRQADIVEHDAEAGGDQPAREQNNRRPEQVQGRDDERDDAEYRIAKQVGRQQTGLAKHGLETGVARQRYRRELNRKIAQIQRATDGQEADDEQPLHVVRRQPKWSF